MSMRTLAKSTQLTGSHWWMRYKTTIFMELIRMLVAIPLSLKYNPLRRQDHCAGYANPCMKPLNRANMSLVFTMSLLTTGGFVLSKAIQETYELITTSKSTPVFLEMILVSCVKLDPL